MDFGALVSVVVSVGLSIWCATLRDATLKGIG